MRHYAAAACAALALLVAQPSPSRAQQPAPAEATATSPAATSPAAADLLVDRAPAIALHGDVKYAPGFTHFAYVNPDAPKGGSVALGALGSFDTLNQFTVAGESAAGLGMVYQTLMVGSDDEPFTRYGEIASDITVPKDRSWVEFGIDPKARWNDGQPVTADDVAWTFDMLTTKGAPFYRSYYADVAEAKVLPDNRVRFTFRRAGNAELPLIVTELPVLPKHWWASRDFAAGLREPPLGSGPYRVASFEPGRRIVYERVKDWWGSDLPTDKGRYNFDSISFEYFRDPTPLLEALKSGQLDFRLENVAKSWAQDYDIPAVAQGRLVKEEIDTELPSGMQGFVFNTRRPIFQDVRVRQALAQMFDFQWMNRSLFFGSYARTDSYFAGSKELASTGVPEGAELALLEPFRDKLPPELFTQPIAIPDGDGSGNLRDNTRAALRLLKQAGWELKGGTLQNAAGQPFTFEILNVNPSFERVILPYVGWLKKIGVQASLRTVDSAQYQRLTDDFDYDMIVGGTAASLSPGNEQREYWGCAARDAKGSNNQAGACDPVIDALIDRLVLADSRADLVAAVHALDRVLLWHWYVVPQWYLGKTRLAHWDRFGKPDTAPPYDVPYSTDWWVDPAKDAALKGKGGQQ